MAHKKMVFVHQEVGGFLSVRNAAAVSGMMISSAIAVVPLSGKQGSRLLRNQSLLIYRQSLPLLKPMFLLRNRPRLLPP